MSRPKPCYSTLDATPVRFVVCPRFTDNHCARDAIGPTAVRDDCAIRTIHTIGDTEQCATSHNRELLEQSDDEVHSDARIIADYADTSDMDLCPLSAQVHAPCNADDDLLDGDDAIRVSIFGWHDFYRCLRAACFLTA